MNDAAKGQLISKCLFCVFKFFQKTNEKELSWGIIVVKSNIFIRFLEELRITKSPFEIKVRTFWEALKIWKNLPHGFDKSADLLSKRQNHEEDFSNYVCFSKSPNFKFWLFLTKNDDFYFKLRKKFPNRTSLRPLKMFLKPVSYRF